MAPSIPDRRPELVAVGLQQRILWPFPCLPTPRLRRHIDTAQLLRRRRPAFDVR